jgi:hypothetical protein
MTARMLMGRSPFKEHYQLNTVIDFMDIIYRPIFI